jgi:acyl carrier protein
VCGAIRCRALDGKARADGEIDSDLLPGSHVGGNPVGVNGSDLKHAQQRIRFVKVSEFLNCICVALDRTPDSLKLDDTPQTVPEWDSLGHLSIISAIERQLKYRMTTGDMRGFASLGELVTKLKSRGALQDD